MPDCRVAGPWCDGCGACRCLGTRSGKRANVPIASPQPANRAKPLSCTATVRYSTGTLAGSTTELTAQTCPDRSDSPRLRFKRMFMGALTVRLAFVAIALLLCLYLPYLALDI